MAAAPRSGLRLRLSALGRGRPESRDRRRVSVGAAKTSRVKNNKSQMNPAECRARRTGLD
jgi:hypothetical protein